MSVEKLLEQRANSQCELCAASTQLSVYPIPPESNNTADQSVLICQTCLDQIEERAPLDQFHWRALSSSMWSEHAPVQVMAWRMLNRLQNESWAQDLLGQLYLDDDLLAWAQADQAQSSSGSEVVVKDSNGTQLLQGDSVTLIKDLEVKGAGFTAKRGTLVKNINLTDDPKFIEGRINGTTIVLVAAYLKKVTG